jgi:hypothetical protein
MIGQPKYTIEVRFNDGTSRVVLDESPDSGRHSQVYNRWARKISLNKTKVSSIIEKTKYFDVTFIRVTVAERPET